MFLPSPGNAVLDPMGKMAYFKKHWSADLCDEVLACAEEVVWKIKSLNNGPHLIYTK
jgi:hypothetical protein